MKYLSKALQKTWMTTKKHKLLFITLVIIQIAFFALLLYVSWHYNLKVMSEFDAIRNVLGEEDYSNGALSTTGMSATFHGFHSIIDHITYFAVWVLAIFSVINGLLWVCSHQMYANRNWKKASASEVAQRWLKYASSSILLLAPFLVAGHYLLKRLVSFSGTEEQIFNITYVLVGLLVVFYYVLVVASAFIHARSWKKWMKITFATGIKNLHKVLPILLLNVVVLTVVGGSGYWMFIHLPSLWLLIISALLLIVVLVVSRIFWIAALWEIGNEKGHH